MVNELDLTLVSDELLFRLGSDLLSDDYKFC